jgi:hypothetical protein
VLTWRNVSNGNLRDFIGSDEKGRDVARILKPAHEPEWTWSVYAIVPARSGLTHGREADLKEARLKADAAWAHAKAKGKPSGNHVLVDPW